MIKLFNKILYKSKMSTKNNKGKFLFNLKLKRILQKNNDIIIVCIGTPNVVGDSIGPIIGSKLQLNNCKYPVYGTILNPITALNIEDKISEIVNNHPLSKILAIDACVAKQHNILNTIILNNTPIKPGAGLNKELLQIGDYSIKVAIIDYSENEYQIIKNLLSVDPIEVDRIANNIVDIVL